MEGPTSNWLVNMGSAVGSVGGVRVTYRSNRPHGGFGNLLVSIGTHAGSIGSHHLRQHSGGSRHDKDPEDVGVADAESHKSVETNGSQDSFYSTTSDGPTSSSTSESALRRGSAASDESYPGARLFVRQLSAYLAQDESDRDSLFICEHPKVGILFVAYIQNCCPY